MSHLKYFQKESINWLKLICQIHSNYCKTSNSSMPTDATIDKNETNKVFFTLSISGSSMTLEYLFIQSSNEFFIVSYFLLKKYFHLAIVTIILYNLLTKSTKMQVSLKVGWLTWILEDLFARPFCFLRVVCSFLMFGYAINLIEFSSKKYRYTLWVYLYLFC